MVYLIRIIFLPFKRIDHSIVKVRNELEKGEPHPSRRNMSFEVDGDKIDVWLYLPETTDKPVPCIIMSNGFCGTKGMVLESYAKEYLKHGLATLTYDFRSFGLSQGQPRQWFDVKRQLEDLHATVAFARSLDEIDSDQIILWGTSAGGGYGLIEASRDKKIAGVIGQCPSLDKKADGEVAVKREGMKYFLSLFMHAQRDKGRSRFGLSPHYIPVVGKEGHVAFFAAVEAEAGYSGLISPTFDNKVTARSMLGTPHTNPIDFSKNVSCPVLIQSCEKDNLVSKASYVETAKLIGDSAKIITYPCGHFDIYVGKDFELAVKDQIDFILDIVNQ